MKVALAFNVKRNQPSADLALQHDLEFDSPQVIEAIKKALESLGHQVFEVEANSRALSRLSRLKGQIDIVFNIAEGLSGDAREAQIPLFCEMLGIPYTHSSPTAHALGLNKHLTTLTMAGAGINVAKSLLVTTKKDLENFNLTFPVIIKPNQEGSSKGVFDANVVDNRADLSKQTAYISESFAKPLLIEEFIDGREFSVALIGSDPAQILPIIEQKFALLPAGMKKIASYELKWVYEEGLDDMAKAFDCPAKLDRRELELIETTSIKVYRILRVWDCARIDYRFTANGRLYFLEVNTLPGINPDPQGMSYFVYAAKEAGLSYKQMIAKILDSASRRFGLKF